MDTLFLRRQSIQEHRGYLASFNRFHHLNCGLIDSIIWSSIDSILFLASLPGLVSQAIDFQISKPKAISSFIQACGARYRKCNQWKHFISVLLISSPDLFPFFFAATMELKVAFGALNTALYIGVVGGNVCL
ncbi:hypothetical protein L6452_04367 [Arctium lappa]|uniref:Uncharacterized protein n=1 Tax=Arctium lappa TaxID=4217 RepID=A0ACB9FPU5_ARCLA|nr:hypothetical protein L6452_04367 [Arctium lappa]